MSLMYRTEHSAIVCILVNSAFIPFRRLYLRRNHYSLCNTANILTIPLDVV